MTDGFRSWSPGWSSSLSVFLDEEDESRLKELASDNPMSRQSLVLKSCITSTAQAAALANVEADPELLDQRLALAALVFNELLTIFDLPHRADHFEAKLIERMNKYFEDRGWSGPTADPTVDELVKLLLKASKELSEGKFDFSVETVIELEDKANKCFSSTKHFSQRAIFTRFIIFAVLFRACYSKDLGFTPLSMLPPRHREDIHAFLRARVKSLFDAVKRKSTFFSSSIKNKHQDSMDELLRVLYPLYSVSRGWSSPYLLVRDFGPEEHIELQINPELLPCSEERSVLLQLGRALVNEEDLAPVFIFLWRDEKNLFLRRQEKLFRFVVTHGGPNSILQIQLARDRIKSKNTLHPTHVSSDLPKKLLPIEKLVKDIESPLPSQVVYKEMALLGDLQLQALGLQINHKNNLGQTLLHLAVHHGKLEIVAALLDAGSQRHMQDNAGLHPLVVAIIEASSLESEETAERLVRLLATDDDRLDLPDSVGRTALHHASALASSSLRSRLVTALVEAGAPLASIDAQGDRPVDVAYRLTETTLFDTGN